MAARAIGFSRSTADSAASAFARTDAGVSGSASAGKSTGIVISVRLNPRTPFHAIVISKKARKPADMRIAS